MSEVKIFSDEVSDEKPNYSFPEATQVLPYDASDEDWKAQRGEGIGGSDASVIMGENRYKELLDLYEDKKGLAPAFEGNYLTRRGHYMEDFLRSEFTREMGIKTQLQGMLQNNDRPYMRVNVDALTSDGGVFESKVHSHHLKDDWSEEEGRVSSESYWQVQHAMAVTGRSHAWIVADVGGQLHIVFIERNEDDIEDLIAEIDDFWHYHVLENVPPKPERLGKIKQVYSRANVGKKAVADKQVVQDLVKYREAKAAESKAKELSKHHESRIRRFMESADILVDENGVIIATNKQNGTFAETRFREDHPKLFEKYHKQKKSVDTQRLKKTNEKLYTRYRARVLR
ncbi:MAG: YqaJ viral recombinase family protein [Micrococcaceae bacterium]|nr:YqaJ viral recombinase family protein [Micrococcaceae bacterium]